MVKARKTKTSATVEVVLSGSLTLSAAREIRQKLLQALDDADTVKVQLQDVNEMDLSVVQIFCAAHRSAILKKKALVLQTDLPEQYIQTYKDAGLDGHVGCSSGERDGCAWQRR